MLSLSSALQPRTSILPEGGRDFLRRRMMEIVGVATAGFGLMLMMALFTYSPGDPSLNHATARAPNNLLGLPGAYTPTCSNEQCPGFERLYAAFAAEGAADMVRQMVGDEVPLAWCG
eukprot:gene53263-71211_t